METKAFSMQSPEAIAKQYGGNKQKIAQAMQMGIIDPTAGTLAGMFIDRMRAAAQAEQAPQQTVAQKTFAPPAPPQQQMPPQAPPQAGLGATPPAGQAPPMGMAAGGMVAFADGGPVTFADGGMGMVGSGGGLPSLQVPDDMFNSSLGDGGDIHQYASGGVVSFAAGSPGMTDLYDDVEYQESRGNQNAVSPAGARGVMQLMPGTMKDPGFGITPMQNNSEAENRRVGQQYLDAMYKKYGNRTHALMAYNWGPGNMDKWLASGANMQKVPTETLNYVKKVTGSNPALANAPAATGAPAARGTPVSTLANYVEPDLSAEFEPSMVKGMSFYDKYAPQTHKAADKLMEEADRLSNPETIKKQEHDDKWMALADFGFKLAGSNSPYFLQAVGEAASAALPGMKADKKEREARRLEAIKMYAQAEGITNEQATKRADAGVKYATTTLDIKEKSLARGINVATTLATFENNLDVVKEQGKNSLAVARENAAAQIDASTKLSNAEKLKYKTALASIPLQATNAVDGRIASDKGYMDLKGKPAEQAAYRARLIDAEQARLVKAIEALVGPTSGELDFETLDKNK